MKTERPIPQQDEIRHSVCVHFGGVEGNWTPVRRISHKDLYSLGPTMDLTIRNDRVRLESRGYKDFRRMALAKA